MTELKYEVLCVGIKGPAGCPYVKKMLHLFFIHILKFEVGQNSNRDLMSLKVCLLTLMTFSCTCMLRDYKEKEATRTFSLRTCYDLIHEFIYSLK